MSNETTIKLTGGDMGVREIRVRCDLSQAAQPVQVNYCRGFGWQTTPYLCESDFPVKGELIHFGRILAARVVDFNFRRGNELTCDVIEVDDE
jgi:hypothetical protein